MLKTLCWIKDIWIYTSTWLAIWSSWFTSAVKSLVPFVYYSCQASCGEMRGTHYNYFQKSLKYFFFWLLIIVLNPSKQVSAYSIAFEITAFCKHELSWRYNSLIQTSCGVHIKCKQIWSTFIKKTLRHIVRHVSNYCLHALCTRARWQNLT